MNRIWVFISVRGVGGYFTSRLRPDFRRRSSTIFSVRFFFNFFLCVGSSLEYAISGNSPPSGSLSESLELFSKKNVSLDHKKKITNLDSSCSVMVEWHWVNASRQPETELMDIVGSFVGFSSGIFNKLMIKIKSENSFYLDKPKVITLLEVFLFLIFEEHFLWYPKISNPIVYI